VPSTVIGVYRFLLNRQWVSLTILGLVMMPVMVRLGFWQLHRHESRVADNKLISTALHKPGVPVESLTAPGRAVPTDDVWRTVTALGTYDTKDEVVVRQRTGNDESSIGYFLVTPLILRDGKAILINRGWIPAGDNLIQFPPVPAAPTGQVKVTGRMRADETSASSGIRDTKGLPPRQVMLINSHQQAKRLDRPVLGGYIELTKSTPAGVKQPQMVAPPDDTSIGPHLAYAIQWWMFTVGVPIGWVVLVRREVRERAEAAEKAAKAAKAAETTEADGTAEAGETTEVDETAEAGGTAEAGEGGKAAETAEATEAGEAESVELAGTAAVAGPGSGSGSASASASASAGTSASD
jgi:cytochrome oxidase assembly protein ShyY1